MCNGAFVEKFVNSHALFLPFVASDHAPAVIEIPVISGAKPRPFKFANFLADKGEFLPTVKKVWDSHIPGHAMFSVVSKLKLLKKPFRKLKFAQGDLAKKVLDSRHELERVQAMMVDDSFNPVLRKKETECLRAYKDAMRDEESMLKQRAKVSWLSEGDSNTKYFHNSVKGNLNRNRIESVEDLEGKRFSGQHVGAQFVKHFQSVLGEAKLVDPIFDPGSLFVKRLSIDDAEFMVRPVSKDEIKSVFFAMNDEKAPGPDGFSSKFFKAAWSVIGDEVCTAICDFFKNGRLLKEVNATIIALVPKSMSPQKVSDFRPISCCNVIYKAISKIIANRIKGCLGILVDECQNAFIPTRQISDNVLLSQELVRNYHRNRGPSKVAFKIDIHKAYDSVEWSFMKQCLVHFGFHNNMITWIMSCLSSPMFSVNVNGYSHGFFKGMRGLRQGDPLSPYLFTLVMEVFSLMVKRKIEDDGNFKYHWRCDKLKITHLSFADDLMIFSSADLHSVKILSKALSEFSGVSGLVPNLDKSSVFFGNVPENLKSAILQLMPLSVGILPVKYLGLPLITSRLSKHHCSGLIDNVKKRLLNWKNKALSFAGRLQLLNSVVSSIQVYWASTFILPKAINAEVERLMRGFLWSHGELRKGQAKVKWKDVCCLKSQGGLGIKLLNTRNVSLIAKMVWNIVSKKDSLWVKWINSYRLTDRSSNLRNFWDVPTRNDCSWGWRKILQCRDDLREHIVHRIGDGSQTSVWFDVWSYLGPLSNFISKRDIYDAGMSLDCRVCDIVERGEWVWPEMWRSKFPVLFLLPPPIIFRGRNDKVMWKTNEGKVVDFSVSTAWADLSIVKPVVPWRKLVWFSQNVPRHAFMLWLAISQKLKTQDRMEKWLGFQDVKCSLCSSGSESHNHLFFECSYSLEVWNHFKELVKWNFAPIALPDIVHYAVGRPINRSIWSILQRLTIGALVYFIWQERNLRRFQDKCRPVSELCGIIRDNVRLRLMSLKIKKSVQVMEAAGIWDFGVNECNDGRRYSCYAGSGACWADDGSRMAWMLWAFFLCWACSRVEDIEVLDLDIISVEFINFFDTDLFSHIVISLVCSKVYLAISFLSMFPKHVLGMSFRLTYMGLSI
ncbi:RNA-directed DNA polymerase, eukaryota, reverse transcriptase zinc-binding domain protein [Tanacetum coccineum]